MNLRRDQVARLEQEALQKAALRDDVHEAETFEVYAAALKQLGVAMDALARLKGMQIWLTAEAYLAREKGHAGVIVLVVPRRGVAGAGIGVFSLLEASALMLPESRRAYFGELGAAAYETAFAQAEAAPQNPNGADG